MPNNPKPVILTQEGEQIFPLTDASLVAGLSTALSGKQDTISDLSTIRSGASAGATAYQKPSTGIPASDMASGAIPTVPAISTNIQTDKSSTTTTASPSAVYNEVHPAFGSSQPAGGMLPNVLYKLGTLSGNTAFVLATPADANIANHYFWTFETGSAAPTITWPAVITSWFGGSAPTINASKHYEVSLLDGVAIAMEA